VEIVPRIGLFALGWVRVLALAFRRFAVALLGVLAVFAIFILFLLGGSSTVETSEQGTRSSLACNQIIDTTKRQPRIKQTSKEQNDSECEPQVA
jgi:hypothetical protein